jgi:glycosyltransferase involved in cell wall biosynthesis
MSAISKMPAQTLPDISVVIPCYNAARWVSRAIESVLTQTGVAVEVIVIDDGSTDASLDAIKRHAERIRWESGPNRGACTARNRGLALASAKYVMFLDADDYIEGPLLQSAVRSMRQSQADLAFGEYVHERGKSRKKYLPPTQATYSGAIFHLLQTSFIPPCSTIWRTEFIKNIDGWMDGLRRNQDFEIVLRALGKRPAISVISDGLGISYQHNDFPRISGKNDIETIKDQISVVKKILQYLAEAGYSTHEAKNLLLRKCYQLWRMAARSGTIEAEHLTKNLYYEMGGRAHRGGWRHKTLSTIMGLRRKEWLSKRVSLLKQAFSNINSL